MLTLRPLNDRFAVAPQIHPDDLPAIKAAGYVAIVNNRPDDEETDQPAGDELRAAAEAAGLAYTAIPVTQAGFSHPQLDAMAAALVAADGPVLAYCRSGTRSCNLWALAAAKDRARAAPAGRAGGGGGGTTSAASGRCSTRLPATSHDVATGGVARRDPGARGHRLGAPARPRRAPGQPGGSRRRRRGRAGGVRDAGRGARRGRRGGARGGVDGRLAAIKRHGARAAVREIRWAAVRSVPQGAIIETEERRFGTVVLAGVDALDLRRLAGSLTTA